MTGFNAARPNAGPSVSNDGQHFPQSSGGRVDGRGGQDLSADRAVPVAVPGSHFVKART